jgi:hypothetical protein
MKTEDQAIAEEIREDCIFYGMESCQWKQVGSSYFVRVPYSNKSVPTWAERIELNERFMVFAFYCKGWGGKEKIVGYEVRPLIPPQLDVMGAAVFLRYSDGLSPGGHTKAKVGAKRWPLIVAQYDNGDVMFTLALAR